MNKNRLFNAHQCQCLMLGVKTASTHHTSNNSVHFGHTHLSMANTQRPKHEMVCADSDAHLTPHLHAAAYKDEEKWGWDKWIIWDLREAKIMIQKELQWQPILKLKYTII